jgi:hypothetical protein
MQSVSTVTRQVVQQQRSGQVAQPQQGPSLSDAAARNVNDIFRALQASFPAWRNAFPDDASLKAAKASWVKGLMAAGVTDLSQIARGVEKARLSESDFFPSVGKFISWCRVQPADLGLPPDDVAWLEANHHSHHVLIHQWTHPAIYEAGRRTGWFEIRNGDATQKAFSSHYQAVAGEIAEGAVFTMPAADSTRLEHHTNGTKVQTEQAKQTGKAALAELKKGMGLNV